MRAWFCIAILAMAMVACLGQSPPSAKSKDALAVVAGQPIFEQDLAPLIQGQMRQLRTQEYEVRSQALENLIEQKLLEAEAGKRGIPAQKLLEQEVDSKAGEPTEAELEAYYLGQKDRINRPFDEVKPQLFQAFKQARLQQARQDFYKRLREKANVAVFLRAPRTEMGYDPARVRGNAKAGVTIVEFSDFQCPFCRRVQPTLRELLSKYEGRVNLAYRDFPLREIHPQAQNAAEAARCAAEQGKFWEYHDLLLGDASKLNPPGLAEYASGLGLDRKQFDACLKSGKFKPQVEEDLQEGLKAGVSGTPSFYINGVFLSGAQPAAAFQKIIDAELAVTDQK
ncbi:MAG: thioredoxin domain-containing protein [Acidobacteria bacterium]|nr:thioredoxin domain-containing protein [Acidobacteriota bacterium]